MRQVGAADDREEGMRGSLLLCSGIWWACAVGAGEPGFAIPDTGQDRCYGPRAEIAFPSPGQEYFGQDAQYRTNTPKYRDNGDGTVSDLVTGLMWQKTPNSTKLNQAEAEAYAAGFILAGHDDWRLPTIKELFSLVDFRGNMHTRTPYIDTRYFDFQYPASDIGEEGRPGERRMDAQYCSATRYLGITMGRDRSAFGFNFADGRIKSYPLEASRYVRCVRGQADYGRNRFVANGDGTVTDTASGLTWQQADSGRTFDWPGALQYAEALTLGGHDDWRLPDVKELQSIVDYDRAPDALDPAKRGPAIDPVFALTTPESWCWTSTTHIETGGAYYVCFGQAFSARRRAGRQINAHGAGAVRSDPKTGDPGRWPDGRGPQNDEVRIQNYVRCVRGGPVELVRQGPAVRAETPAGPGALAGFIQRLDRDGDNRISPQEFDGPARDFPRLDRNHDGYIDASEAPSGPPR